jgi:Fe2+ or Zn2+ uptake regulation protein
MLPVISRATVYNTLNLLVEKKLLRQSVMDDGRSVYDPNLEPHHHFIDDETGRIYDIPWDDVQVGSVDDLGTFDVREYHLVLRGRARA